MKLIRSIVPLFCLIFQVAPVFGQGQNQTPENNGGPASARPAAPAPTEQLDFQTGLFTGRFGYTVPLELAPARHGSAPSIALRYNSAGDSGWCGVGWSLDLGYIERETRKGVPVLWANGVASTAYDDAKGFVFSLNGRNSNLVKLPSGEYRAEIEGDFLVFQLTSGNYWLVTDKSGTKYYFGETASTRMSNSKAGWSSSSASGTFHWALDQIVTANGDKTTISYTTISSNIYPQTVSYNGHTSGLATSCTVQFNLADRPDARISLRSGYRADQTKRLDSIVHKVGTQLVWSNKLNYVLSPSTQRSLLNSITRFGTNQTDSLPPITFGYSQQTFGFNAPVQWTNLFVPSGGGLEYVGLTGANEEIIDMDGDGLPDRVIAPAQAPFTNWWVQLNTGAGFGAATPWSFGFQTLSNGVISAYGDSSWSPVQSVHGRLIDINGDGRPDRVNDPIECYYNGNLSNPTLMTNIMKTNYDRFVVEFGGGTNLLAASSWPGVEDQTYGPTSPGWTFDFRAVENQGRVAMLDMNGDGLPDRLMIDRCMLGSGGVSNYVVQFNTGGGFSGTNKFGPFVSRGGSSYDLNWNGLNGYVRMLDINGDGLPDRVMLVTNLPGTDYGAAPAQYQTNFVVELNNGYGFEPPILWTNVDPQCVICNGTSYANGFADLGDSFEVALRDVNGDGLPDRVFISQCQPYTNWMVQLNTGTGFGPTQSWGAINNQGQGQSTAAQWAGIQNTKSMLLDMNGDGLPDRVTVVYNGSVANNYFFVEFSKGPVPDLMTVVSNGIGGSVNVTYKSSTQYNNRDSSGRQLLPMSQWTVAAVSINDGIYLANTTTYSYEGGYWNYVRREFNGFAKTTVSDPLGLTTAHWFHQSGGRDNSSVGEYLDSTNAIAKVGMPFRIETIGSDGKLYHLELKKVQDADLGNGRDFAYVCATINIDYPGGDTNSYRASAKGYLFDTSNGNLTNEVNYGEISSVGISGQTFTDTGNDTTYQITTFTNFANNTNILNKPQRVLLSSAASGQPIIRETLSDYDSSGNLICLRDQICSDPQYKTVGFAHDSYGNTWRETNAAGIVTETTYDSVSHAFPIQEVVGGILTNIFSYDARSGKLLTSTGPSGLVTANSYDAFLRLSETDVSTTSNGTANHQMARYNYGLGMSGGISTNYVHLCKSDGVDSVNGHETWTYLDGFGRVVQVRQESEVNGFRVSDTVYDGRGNVQFLTLPYFSSGTSFSKPSGTELGTLHEYDPIARLYRVTPGVNGAFTSGQLTSTSSTGGDTGSPSSASTIAYKDASDPWTLVCTDEAGKVHKYSLDAYGRTNQIVEVFNGSSYTTKFSYNLAGDLLAITNNANNVIQYAYDNLGQIVAMADPDMGVWFYKRDAAGRIREQVDADGQTIKFTYDDPLGRLHTRLVFDFKTNFVYGITNVYDNNGGDSAFTVFPGQLYKTIDKEGWEKYGYDLRGRAIKTSRYIDKTKNTYTHQFSYDDQDRQTSIVYPNGGLTVTNIYDFGGNLSKVQQVGGSGTAYYSATAFDAFGHLKNVSYGNGVAVAYTYYPNSARLQQVTGSKGGTTLQNLTYTFDAVSNLRTIVDATTNSGAASASISSTTYDDLHRLTALTRPTGSISFSYDSIGNMTTNGEAGSGTYNYGTRAPHTVKSANNKNYAYDLNGNMLVRGNQHLEYDPENRLVLARSTNSTTTFGYSATGARLWKQTSTTNGLQIWVGNTYEEKNGRVLYHIRAGDLLACTFDSTTTAFNYIHSDHLHSTSITTDANGNKMQHYEYSAFGRDRFTESATAFPLSHRFTSQIKDEDTGLYYYNARYYDPELGRFIQPDTMLGAFANPQGLNRYSYGLNNPLKHADTSGHFVFLAPLIYGAVAGVVGYSGIKVYEKTSIAASNARTTVALDSMTQAHGYANYNDFLASQSQNSTVSSGTKEQIQMAKALGESGYEISMAAAAMIVPELRTGEAAVNMERGLVGDVIQSSEKKVSQEASRTKWGPEHGTGNVEHNNAIEDVLDAAESRGAVDIRKNRVQRDAAGKRVYADDGSYTRPDGSWVENGTRHNYNRVSNLENLAPELDAVNTMVESDSHAVVILEF